MAPAQTLKSGNIPPIGRGTIVFLIIFSALLPCCAGLVTAAETFYVAPSAEVPLRIAPDSKRKIVAILSDGAKVELIRKEGDWANVRTISGREGWILKRYLSPTLPLKEQVAALKAENKRLKEQLVALQKSEKSSSSERDSCIAERDELSRKYNNLKIEAADAINTKKLLERTTRELNKTKQEAALLKSQLADTENNQRLKWFLAGGGVLLTGWILGVLFRKRGKRRSSLL